MPEMLAGAQSAAMLTSICSAWMSSHEAPGELGAVYFALPELSAKATATK